MIDFTDDPMAWLAAIVILDIALGGAAAVSAGRAIARAWRPFWVAAAYMAPLGAGVGFLHYAIFGLPAISLDALSAALAQLTTAPATAIQMLASACAYWAGLTCVLILFAFIGFRATRRGQMIRNYGWMFEGSGPLRWRRRQQA